jgi:hypothetical protein
MVTGKKVTGVDLSDANSKEMAGFWGAFDAFHDHPAAPTLHQ